MKAKRNYALFWKDGKRWRRLTAGSFVKSVAIRIFQDRLLAGTMSGVRTELRPTIPNVPADHLAIALANTEWMDTVARGVKALARSVPNSGTSGAGTIQ